MKRATREAFWDILEKLWEINEKIVVLDADLSGSTKTSSFAKKFPERFFNMWISEADMTCSAVWLALAGKIPVCASFSIFSTWRAWEQVRNSICYSNIPVKIIWTHAWILTWEDWATHQALEDIAILRSIPNLKIIQPIDEIETLSAFAQMINEPFPVYFRLWRAWVENLNDENYKFELWKNTVLKTWTDVVIFTSWAVSYNAISATRILSEKWISCSVVNISSIKPFDRNNVIEMCKKHKKAFSVEDHSIIWWIWSAISEVLAEEGISCPLKRIWMTTFWESWTSEDLYEKYWFTPEKIAETILKSK